MVEINGACNAVHLLVTACMVQGRRSKDLVLHTTIDGDHGLRQVVADYDEKAGIWALKEDLFIQVLNTLASRRYQEYRYLAGACWTIVCGH